MCIKGFHFLNSNVHCMRPCLWSKHLQGSVIYRRKHLVQVLYCLITSSIKNIVSGLVHRQDILYIYNVVICMCVLWCTFWIYWEGVNTKKYYMTTYKWTIYIYKSLWQTVQRQSTKSCCMRGYRKFSAGGVGGVKVHYYIVFALEERGVRSNFR